MMDGADCISRARTGIFATRSVVVQGSWREMKAAVTSCWPIRTCASSRYVPKQAHSHSETIRRDALQPHSMARGTARSSPPTSCSHIDSIKFVPAPRVGAGEVLHLFGGLSAVVAANSFASRILRRHERSRSRVTRPAMAEAARKSGAPADRSAGAPAAFPRTEGRYFASTR